MVEVVGLGGGVYNLIYSGVCPLSYQRVTKGKKTVGKEKDSLEFVQARRHWP